MSQRESYLEQQYNAKTKQINEIKTKMMQTASPSLKNSLKQQALSLLRQRKMFVSRGLYLILITNFVFSLRIENQLNSARVCLHLS